MATTKGLGIGIYVYIYTYHIYIIFGMIADRLSRKGVGARTNLKPEEFALHSGMAVEKIIKNE